MLKISVVATFVSICHAQDTWLDSYNGRTDAQQGAFQSVGLFQMADSNCALQTQYMTYGSIDETTGKVTGSDSEWNGLNAHYHDYKDGYLLPSYYAPNIGGDSYGDPRDPANVAAHGTAGVLPTYPVNQADLFKNQLYAKLGTATDTGLNLPAGCDGTTLRTSTDCHLKFEITCSVNGVTTTIVDIATENDRSFFVSPCLTGGFRFLCVRHMPYYSNNYMSAHSSGAPWDDDQYWGNSYAGTIHANNPRLNPAGKGGITTHKLYGMQGISWSDIGGKSSGMYNGWAQEALIVKFGGGVETVRHGVVADDAKCASEVGISQDFTFEATDNAGSNDCTAGDTITSNYGHTATCTEKYIRKTDRMMMTGMQSGGYPSKGQGKCIKVSPLLQPRMGSATHYMILSCAESTDQTTVQKSTGASFPSVTLLAFTDAQCNTFDNTNKFVYLPVNTCLYGIQQSMIFRCINGWGGWAAFNGVSRTNVNTMWHPMGVGWAAGNGFERSDWEFSYPIMIRRHYNTDSSCSGSAQSNAVQVMFQGMRTNEVQWYRWRATERRIQIDHKGHPGNQQPWTRTWNEKATHGEPGGPRQGERDAALYCSQQDPQHPDWHLWSDQAVDSSFADGAQWGWNGGYGLYNYPNGRGFEMDTCSLEDSPYWTEPHSTYGKWDCVPYPVTASAAWSIALNSDKLCGAASSTLSGTGPDDCIADPGSKATGSPYFKIVSCSADGPRSGSHFHISTSTPAPGVIVGRGYTDAACTTADPANNNFFRHNGGCHALNGGDWTTHMNQAASTNWQYAFQDDGESALFSCTPGTPLTNVGMYGQADYVYRDPTSDECAPAPCKNGATCTDLLFDYSCDCAATGYGGKNCDEPVGNNPFVAASASAGDPASYTAQHNGGGSAAQGPVKSYAGRDAKGGAQDYTDASPNPTGASHGGRDPRREPHASWSGDLDPKSRSLQGTMTIRPGMDARKLQKWNLYPTGDGTYLGRKGLHFADGQGDANTKTAQYSHTLLNQCGASCTNNSPYSPKCKDGCSETKLLVAHDGTRATVTREKITILAGDSGEFYISRIQNQVCEYGTTYDPAKDKADKQGTLSGGSVETYLTDPTLNSPALAAGVLADRTCAGDTSEDHYRTSQLYGAGETSTIEIPSDGWLTLVLHDFSTSGATLSCGSQTYTATTDVDKAKDVLAANDITWTADNNPGGKGWTFLFQPNYPEVEVSGLMANGASGFVIVGEYENGEDYQNTRYVETRDWMVPNVTCTPTTLHCPIPNVWAHIDYTTPSMYPEPAEGSCEQVRTGSSSLSRCSDKDDTNTRWYAVGSISTTSLPGQNPDSDDTEDNGQAFADDTFGVKHNNWAGNCGDSTSYFWFEKIACGSTRIFHTDGRSLIEDSVVLSPTWEAIRDILAQYYTTKAPLNGAKNENGMEGFTFINADYHVAPVLPPKVECSCLAAMDAYASLLSVQSKTPTPGAPVTLDPEVLNTGSSKIVATLRMYHDPTYSLSAEQDSTIPIVVSRFYLEVSTKFTRNRITISDCTASNREQLLNGSSALKPRSQYCDNTTFDTRTESSPAGVTHMDRISMKKFKFHTTTDVFMQCKIRACAAQPCGSCQRRQLASSTDLSPVEGEMFAPPTKIQVSPFDKNALVFQATNDVYTTPTGVPSAVNTNIASATSSLGVPITTQPIQIASQMVLPFSTLWINENRASLISTLRTTLGLNPNEDLIITSITTARRLESQQRELQSSSAKIDFVIGVADNSRAQLTSDVVSSLASGTNTNLVQSFTATLNQNLRNRGKQTVEINPTQIRFTKPATKTIVAGSGASFSVQSGSSHIIEQSENKNKKKSTTVIEQEGTSLLLIVLAVIFVGIVLYLLARKRAVGTTSKGNEQEMEHHDYISKVMPMSNEIEQNAAGSHDWQ